MAKTKTITFSCGNAHIALNGRYAVEVEVSSPDVGDILNDIDKDDIDDWIRENRNPEGIFSDTELEKWAEANGYVKE